MKRLNYIAQQLPMTRMENLSLMRSCKYIFVENYADLKIFDVKHSKLCLYVRVVTARHYFFPVSVCIRLFSSVSLCFNLSICLL